MKQLIHEEKTQTTCVLRLFGAPLWTVQQAVQQTGLAAQCRSRGAETLAALQTETPAALSKARKALADRFAAELLLPSKTLNHMVIEQFKTSCLKKVTNLRLLRFIARLQSEWWLPYRALVLRLNEEKYITD